MSRISGQVTGRAPALPPTLADVAELAGVSRQTVSNAVNNPDLLRPDTLRPRAGRDRPARLLTQPGGPQPPHPHQPPDRAAVHARRRRGPPTRPMDRFVHSLVETSSAAGYHVLLFPADAEDPTAGYDSLLRATAVDAFVATDTYLGNPQAAWLQSRRAPFVAFGRPWDDAEAGHPWVDVDGAAGAEIATQHLLERGHERIAWIGWRKDQVIGEDRRSGWTRAMRSRGLSTTGLASRSDDTVGSGREASAVLLDEARPTGFVCASDTLALGVMHTLAERGLVAGRDVAVVGFDDSQVAQVVPPGPHLGPAAARGGRGRDRPGARGPARPPAGAARRRAAHPGADRPRHQLRRVRTLRAVVGLGIPGSPGNHALPGRCNTRGSARIPGGRPVRRRAPAARGAGATADGRGAPPRRGGPRDAPRAASVTVSPSRGSRLRRRRSAALPPPAVPRARAPPAAPTALGLGGLRPGGLLPTARSGSASGAPRPWSACPGGAPSVA